MVKYEPKNIIESTFNQK